MLGWLRSDSASTSWNTSSTWGVTISTTRQSVRACIIIIKQHGPIIRTTTHHVSDMPISTTTLLISPHLVGIELGLADDLHRHLLAVLLYSHHTAFRPSSPVVSPPCPPLSEQVRTETTSRSTLTLFSALCTTAREPSPTCTTAPPTSAPAAWAAMDGLCACYLPAGVGRTGPRSTGRAAGCSHTDRHHIQTRFFSSAPFLP